VDAARGGGKDKSAAVRDALVFTANIGLWSPPLEQLRSTADIIRTAIAATATFGASRPF
jgi:hypothetical protein